MRKYDALDLTKYVYGKDIADFWILIESRYKTRIKCHDGLSMGMMKNEYTVLTVYAPGQKMLNKRCVGQPEIKR